MRLQKKNQSLTKQPFLNSASGRVHRARNRTTNQVVAIKIMDLTHQPKKDMLITEIKIMQSCKHENLVNFLDCFFLGNELSLVMEVRSFINIIRSDKARSLIIVIYCIVPWVFCNDNSGFFLKLIIYFRYVTSKFFLSI